MTCFQSNFIGSWASHRVTNLPGSRAFREKLNPQVWSHHELATAYEFQVQSRSAFISQDAASELCFAAVHEPTLTLYRYRGRSYHGSRALVMALVSSFSNRAAGPPPRAGRGHFPTTNLPDALRDLGPRVSTGVLIHRWWAMGTQYTFESFFNDNLRKV